MQEVRDYVAGTDAPLSKIISNVEDKLVSTKQMFSNNKPLDLEDHKDYIENLWNDKKALIYLKSRGFTKETIEHFQIGLEDNWLMIPHFQYSKLWNY